MMAKSKVVRLCILCSLVAALLAGGLTIYVVYRTGPLAKIYGIVDLLDNVFYKPVDREELLEGASRGVVSMLDDPYSIYMSKEEWEEFRIRTSGEYSGIGITIDVREEQVKIARPMKGTPAEEAGLQEGDVILKVDGETVQSSDKAAGMIRGPADTVVVLTVLRGQDTFDVSVTRKPILVPAVESRMLDSEIGLIQLLSFNEHSSKETAEALSDLKSQGAKAIVLDLRYNGGGYVDECLAIAELFIPRGKVVSQRFKSTPEQVSYTSGNGLGMPLVVLVNGGSASASEILAGAIQDREVGLLVGTTTFGKGLVQGAYTLDDGSVVKVTVSEYLTPNGRAINGEGLEPDVVIEGDEAQLAKATELARDALHNPS
jgi:carboxyl-terminal processing protease